MADSKNLNDFPLGGRVVNRVGYGAMQLAGPGVFGPCKSRWPGCCNDRPASLGSLIAG